MISRRLPFFRRGFTSVWLQIAYGSLQTGITGGWAWFTWRGEQQWREAQQQVAAAGYSLHMHEIARGPVPDAENFGATPALKGIVARTADQTPEIKAKTERLRALDPAPGKLLNSTSGPKPDTATGKPRDWKIWRQWLTGPMKWNVPGNPGDDAAAVLSVLQKRDEPLINELVSATRSRSQFGLMPTESRRVGGMMQAKEYTPEIPPLTATFLPLSKYLHLRAEAALHCGRHDEVEKLLPVLTAVIRLTDSDAQFMALLAGHTLELQFHHLIREGIRADRMKAAELEHCQRFLESRRTAPMLKRSFNMELAQFCRALDLLDERRGTLTDFFDGYGTPAPSSNVYSYRIIIPSNQAAAVQAFLENAALLDKEDWAGLKTLHEQRKKRQEATPLLLQFPTMLADGATLGFGALPPKFAWIEMNRRILIAACALQRRRLEGQELPDTLTDLPKRLLGAVPVDIDGQPIRYQPVPQGFVVWSVGENLQDDWKGAPVPDEEKDKEPREQADWQFGVP